MAAIVDALIGPLGGIVALLVGAVGIWLRRSGQQKERAKTLAKEAANEREAHDRITNAPTGRGLSDDERREWLRDIAATWHKHNGPPKT